MSRLQTIESCAKRILEDDPDFVVRNRLLRYVLLRPESHIDENLTHPQIHELQRQQRRDGGWGGLHCGRPTAGRSLPNTEYAVELALALGLEASHPVLRRAATYLTDLLQVRRPFPESERNDRFPAGWRMFAAARLAAIDPHHRAIDPVFSNFRQILLRTFAAGKYDPARERQAHLELHQIRNDIAYLQLANRYAVALLASRQAQLPPEIEAPYVRWLWSQKHLGYLLGQPSRSPQPGATALAIDLWFCSQELLSAFPTWRRISGRVIDWLWNRQNSQGLWDFGSLNGIRAALPLPPDRRSRAVRQQHWSSRVLMLLCKYEGRHSPSNSLPDVESRARSRRGR